MTVTPYVNLPGTAAEALEFYRTVFSGELELHTFASFGRTDGPPDYIAHGVLRGPIQLFISDAGDGDHPFQAQGLLFAVLGVGDPEQSTTWFAALSEHGVVIDPLQPRPWGAWDGQVRDRYGLTWLIGYNTKA